MMLKVLIALLFLNCSILFADFNSFIQDMKQQVKSYTDINTSKKTKNDFLQKMDFSSNLTEITQQHEEVLDDLKYKSDKAILKSLPWISQNMLDGEYDKEIQKAVDAINKNNSQNNEKVDTIFYLFSMSQDATNLFNFVSDASSLETVEKEIKYYGVVQGILNNKELESLYKPFKFDEELGTKAIIKMHPLIFKDLELNRVPAYLFSKCSSGEFQYKKCENKYLVRGDIPLHAALEIIIREDKYYEKFINVLEGRE
ncbi:TrbC family F-type conjugative pilus assembly protein [Sulfurimonas sp.]|uniref:TrbC family F-type conjugative pilus assembly protein n=1 Tax=Sulfurimonas sp. TaxID=2022749 RepID=UPI0025D2EE0F|nr:TrbC family F-type conjugative pilus assembly protein [Sulfurimonas sp.]MBW6487545.1 hypothetical protein [Sulfurimonas sp.]